MVEEDLEGGDVAVQGGKVQRRVAGLQIPLRQARCLRIRKAN